MIIEDFIGSNYLSKSWRLKRKLADMEETREGEENIQPSTVK